MGDLWVWKRDGTTEHRTIRVEKWVSENRDVPLERALGKLEEIEVIPSGKGTVLRGEVHSVAEGIRIAGLVHSYPKDIIDQTQVAAELLNESQKQLEQWLKKSKYTNQLRIERIAETLWVRGNLERPTEVAVAERQLKAIFPLIQTEIESLPDHSPTIYFRVFLLELKRKQFHSVGLSWPASLEGAFHVTTGAVQDLLQIDLTLQQLEGSGNAKILSNPELVVRAPGEAELFAGGEIPIQMSSRYVSNVQWKNYGLTLKLKVTHTAGDRVRLDIFTEVSHLDPALSQDKVPGIQANRMKTQVDARFGVPLLLSGLLQQGIREEAKGLPFLRNIPVLGMLFGSEDYLSERSELVAILYPYSAPPPVSMAQKARFASPRGPAPPPREWLSPQDEKNLREAKDYPWNALE
jgi:pilus assembly protein CpaC